jgi:hypothetical protein
MAGTWVVEAKGRGSRLVVTHVFDVPPALDGADREDATEQVGATIFSTTELVLSRLKAWLERRYEGTTDERGGDHES